MGSEAHWLPDRWRTVWASDIHLGTRASADVEVAHALDLMPCDCLQLPGDTIDLWKLWRSWFPYWPATHYEFLRAVQRKIDQGTEVFVFRGNHDDDLKALIGAEVGVMDLLDLVFKAARQRGQRWRKQHVNQWCEFEDRGRQGIRVVDNLIYRTADGRRLLVLHGDQFDGAMQKGKLLAYAVGDYLYSAVLFMNRWFNRITGIFGIPYVAISRYLKCMAKRAMQYVLQFERLVAEEAACREVDGVVAGHIHKAGIEWIDDVLYANDGDFVEGRTLMAEDYEGNLWILYYDSKKCRLIPTVYFEAATGRILPPPQRPTSSLVSA